MIYEGNPMLAAAIALVAIASFLVGRWYRPAVDEVKVLEEHHRARFALWLVRLWGIEGRLDTAWINDRAAQRAITAIEDPDPSVPPGLAAANVYVDPDHGLRAWVLHTYNLAELRLREIQHAATTRGPKFAPAEESAFQQLLKDARYLHCITEAALYARSQNYDALRPTLLSAMARYPGYFPGAPIVESPSATSGEANQ